MMKRPPKSRTERSTQTRLAGLDKARLCARVAVAHKAEDPLILHVGDLVTFADYFVICSGRSTRHVQAIAEHLEEELRSQRARPIGIEGLPQAQWVLLDCDDVIVHVFYEPVRSIYDLEGLWSEAQRLDLE